MRSGLLPTGHHDHHGYLKIVINNNILTFVIYKNDPSIGNNK